MVQWLRLHASTAGGVGSIRSWGLKIPQCSQKVKLKKKKKILLVLNFDSESHEEGGGCGWRVPAMLQRRGPHG